MTKVDYTGYLESWAAELNVQQDRVRQLIGSAHWLSDGHHKEALVREFLSRYVPPQLVVGSGFIVSATADHACSPELDVLISDPLAHNPLFSQSALTIVAPVAAAAHIQIKSEFGANSLSEALDNVGRAQEVIAATEDASRIWRGIIFYSQAESRTFDSAITTLADQIKKYMDTQSDRLDRAFPLASALPTAVLCIDSWIAFLRWIPDTESVALRCFPVEKLSLACGIADLLAALRYRLGGQLSGHLDDLIERLCVCSPTIIDINLGGQ